MVQNQPFYAALAHLHDFYNITLQESDFEVYALHAWDQIGNKSSKIYKWHTSVVNRQVELPCNADLIEGVFSNVVDFKTIDNIDRQNFVNYDVEAYINQTHVNTSPYYHYGKLVPYQRIGNVLHFEHSEFAITIIYKGVLVDEEGLPYLNFKEVDAIAKYCAFIDTQKKAMMTKDKGTFELSQILRAQWQVAAEDARVPIVMNQNDMNQLLDVMTSWDRKRFGISFKPIR